MKLRIETYEDYRTYLESSCPPHDWARSTLDNLEQLIEEQFEEYLSQDYYVIYDTETYMIEKVMKR